MQKFLLRLIVWLAFRSVGVKEPDRLKVFFAKAYRRPISDLSATHVVINNATIVMIEYSQDRTGDHNESEFFAVREFLRHSVHNRIDDRSAFYGAYFRHETLMKTGQQMTWEETHRKVDNFKEQLIDQLESFFDSWLFKTITHIGRFNA